MKLKFKSIVIFTFCICVAVNVHAGNGNFVNVKALLVSLDPVVNQAVIVTQPLFPGFAAKVEGWDKANGQWQMVMDPMDAVVGRNGLAPVNEKKEGDGRTPSGIFKVYRAFGYKKDADKKLEYKQVTETDFWVDDTSSLDYNQWVHKIAEGTRSFERLKRDDDLYEYAAVIEYNTDPVVSGNGSAIFLHVWRSPDQPTSGCVALSRENILRILKWLDRSQKPVVVIINGSH